ncbi:MAG: acetolactate synthase small subunit [Flavobacteriales bacterium]|jgi:acetolactate synthase I/III small subunit|nr:acetolactate synthase small subunit [Flavobacteriales bacterium]
MKQQYTISVFTENQIGLLNRVSIIFTRRYINIESITASESEVSGIHRYTIVVSEELELIKKVVKQLEKQVDVVKAFFHSNEQVVFQEIALYKLSGLVTRSISLEKIIRNHHARILAMEPEFTILEKTGYKEETEELFNELEPFGILEFVRSGRVAITKPMKKFDAYLHEVEKAAQ